MKFIFYKPILIGCQNKPYKSLLHFYFPNKLSNYLTSIVIKCETHKFLNVINLVLYYCRLFTGYHAQEFIDLAFLKKELLTKDVLQGTLFKPNDP